MFLVLTLSPSSLSLLASAQKMSFDHCAKCGSTHNPQALRRCSRCLSVAYCSSHCQKSHWIAGHKSVCRPPTVLNSRQVVIGAGDAKSAGVNAAAALVAASESWSMKVSSPLLRGTRRIGSAGAAVPTTSAPLIAPAAAGDGSAPTTAQALDDLSSNVSLTEGVVFSKSSRFAANSAASTSSPAPFVMSSVGAPAFVGSPIDRAVPARTRSPHTSTRSIANSSTHSNSPSTTTRTLGLGLGAGSTNSPSARARSLVDGKSPAAMPRALSRIALESSSSKEGGGGSAPGTPSSAASAAAAKAGAAPISVSTPQAQRTTAAAVPNPFVTEWMEVKPCTGESSAERNRGNGWFARRDIPACTPLMIEFGVASSAFPADSEYLE